MFFNTWQDLLRVVVVGILGYIALIGLLRLSGKRTLAKMNMFDFVITIALGSVYGSMLLSKTVSLAEGVTALGLLISLQYGIAWLAVRSNRFQRLIKGTPTLLFYQGEYLREAMLYTRISVQDVHFAVRSQGLGDISSVGAVILETDGSFSVIPKFIGAQSVLLQEIETPFPQEKSSTA